MFDRRFICGESRAVVILKENKYTFEQLQDIFGDIPILYSDKIKTSNVLVFDYLFGFAYGFLLPQEIDPVAFHRLNISTYTFEQTHAILMQMRHQSLIHTIPVYGKYFNLKIEDLYLGKIYPALYVPSQPYDICTMGWDAYHEIYHTLYEAMADDNETLYEFANQDIWYLVSHDLSEYTGCSVTPKPALINTISYSKYMAKPSNFTDYEKRVIRGKDVSPNMANYFCSPTYLSCL